MVVIYPYYLETTIILNFINNSNKVEKIVIRNQISWRSIFAGVIAVLAISMLLSLLGVALGFALLDPESATDISNGSGTAVTIWTLL